MSRRRGLVPARTGQDHLHLFRFGPTLFSIVQVGVGQSHQPCSCHDRLLSTPATRHVVYSLGTIENRLKLPRWVAMLVSRLDCINFPQLDDSFAQARRAQHHVAIHSDESRNAPSFKQATTLSRSQLTPVNLCLRSHHSIQQKQKRIISLVVFLLRRHLHYDSTSKRSPSRLGGDSTM